MKVRSIMPYNLYYLFLKYAIQISLKLDQLIKYDYFVSLLYEEAIEKQHIYHFINYKSPFYIYCLMAYYYRQKDYKRIKIIMDTLFDWLSKNCLKHYSLIIIKSFMTIWH